MGGKAFEGITSRISCDDIPSTLKWLEDQWSDYKLNVTANLSQAILGSAGKSETSGDIDLNLEISRYDQEKVANQLRSILGEEFVKARPGNNQIFTAIPIVVDGHQKGRVQVDFMFGDYEWQKFSYFSPRIGYTGGPFTSESSYKGLYRTELIKALTAFNSDWVLEDDGQMIARVGPTFFHDKGLVWRYRHRPMRKDGKGRVKTLEELSEQEFMILYPSAQRARSHVIKDPQTVAAILLSSAASPKNMETFEKLWYFICYEYTKPQQRLIAKIYIERLNSLKVEIPTTITKILGVSLPCVGQKS